MGNATIMCRESLNIHVIIVYRTCKVIIWLNVQFCVRCGENQVSSCVPQVRRERQGCGLSSNLFYVFIKDAVDCLGTEWTYAPVIGGLRIPGLLYADDLVMACFISYELKKKIGFVNKYCKRWNLICNLKKSNIIIFERGRNLKATRAGK